MPAALITQILARLNDEARRELALASAIAHPGESGRAREQIVGRFLERLLPGGFGLSTGFVIDAVGSISRQIDIVIYRRDYHPVFEIGGVKHFLVESVVAVVENKASLASRATLEDALDNIRSVKTLDRTNRGKNYRVVGTQRGSAVDPDDRRDQVFGAVITQDSLSRATLGAAILEFLKANPRRVWPNFYVDVERFAGFFGSAADPTAISTDTTSASYFALTDSTKPKFIAPLVELAYAFSSYLRVCSLVDFQPEDYLPIDGGALTRWPL